MKITVTKEDIENGCREDPHYCPVALAIKRTSGVLYDVGVWEDCISIRSLDYSIPEIVSAFIALYDRSEPVEPFDFELCI